MTIASSRYRITAELPVNEAIVQGAAKQVRPVMITAMTAILGLLPAALSTKIGSQTQRPLAIVLVGSMMRTLFRDRYLMVGAVQFLRPPRAAGGVGKPNLSAIFSRCRPVNAAMGTTNSLSVRVLGSASIKGNRGNHSPGWVTSAAGA